VPVAARNVYVTVPLIAGAAMAAALVAPAGTAHAQAQRKPAPACGIKSIPFVQGTEWVYSAVAPPEDIRQAAQKIAANKPKQPDQVVIKVVAVKPLPGGAAEITLEETSKQSPAGNAAEKPVIELTKTTTATCARDWLDVSLESFFFAGEPGGALGYEIAEAQRAPSEHSYVFQLGTLRVPEWIVNIKASFKRLASEGVDVELVPGTLDLQRIVKRGAPEPVITLSGNFSATPVQVELVGSVTLAFAPEEKFSIPANTFSKLWIADDVGVVQVANSNGHTYQLAEIRQAGQATTPAGQPAAPAGQPAAPAGQPAAPAGQPAAPAQGAQRPATPAPAAAPARPATPPARPATPPARPATRPAATPPAATPPAAPPAATPPAAPPPAAAPAAPPAAAPPAAPPPAAAPATPPTRR